MRIATAIIILLTACVSGCLSAQSFSFKTYGEEDGLHHSYVYSISQSSKGYLYLSTGEALYRFDGRGFKEYSNPRLKELFVATHLVDSRDLVWIGHNQQGISLLRNEELFHLHHPALNNSKITAFTEMNKRVYASSNGAGLFVVDSTYNLQEVKIGGLQQITSMCRTGNNLLVGTPEGLRICERVSEKDFAIRATVKPLENISIRQIICSNEKDIYWVLTEYDGLFRLKLQKNEVKSYQQWQNELGTQNPGSVIYEDNDQRLWLSVPGEGLRRITVRNEGERVSIQSTLFDASKGLSSQHVQSIYQDNEGNLWFGTFGDGLIQKSQQSFSFYGTSEGLPDGAINKAVPGDPGYNWLGTSKGLFLYNLFESTSQRLLPEVTQVNDLLLEANGRLWIAADKGIFCKEPGGREFIDCFAMLKQEPKNVRCLAMLNGQIVGGTNEGIAELKTDLSRIDWVRTNEGLLHNNVVHLYCDSRKRLWVSSHGTPLYFIKNNKPTVFKDLSGHTAFNFNAVFEDKHKNIWIATEGEGVFRYDGKTFVKFDHEKGLLSDYAIGIGEDAIGSIWVAHRGGLSEKQNGIDRFSQHTRRTGLLQFENSQNAISKGRAGHILFGTNKGLVRYRPAKTGGHFRPRVYINELRFNDQKVPLNEPIEKTYSNYAVHIEFLAITFSQQQDVVYRYRLLGADTAWKTTTMGSLDIPRLSDGEYKFEVVACITRSGLCSEMADSVEFVIRKPIWKNFWFYLLIVGSVIIITLIIIRVRTQQLRGMQHLLQLKVRQKTFLLQREKEAVEKIKGELEIRNKDITDSIHYAKNIQDSILPPDELLRDLFGNNYFVLFRPKDIVSGDIYWAAPLNVNNNNKRELALAAVIDCTGHGVPGAFLSIMANDFLKQSIFSKEVNNTNEILNFLNEEVTSHLNQSQTRRMQDGMDIALVGIDVKKKILYFSGANNPLYIYRQENGQTNNFVLKGTKNAIGHTTVRDNHYAVQIFDIKEGDTIYLFSDGFADQFGGDSDKKFTYRRFRDVLAQASRMPMQDQKDFLDGHLQAWKKDREQTDDVCVMGIRI